MKILRWIQILAKLLMDHSSWKLNQMVGCTIGKGYGYGLLIFSTNMLLLKYQPSFLLIFSSFAYAKYF